MYAKKNGAQACMYYRTRRQPSCRGGWLSPLHSRRSAGHFFFRFEDSQGPAAASSRAVLSWCFPRLSRSLTSPHRRPSLRSVLQRGVSASAVSVGLPAAQPRQREDREAGLLLHVAGPRRAMENREKILLGRVTGARARCEGAGEREREREKERERERERERRKE